MVIANSPMLTCLEIGTELGFEADYVTNLLDMHQQAQNQISLDDLAIEFENFDSSVPLQFQLVERKAIAYVREEGLDSLPSVLELFDKQSMNNSSMPLTVRGFWNSTPMKLVSALAQDDPDGVFEYVARLGEDVDVDLLTAVSEVWFAADPDGTLESIERRRSKYCTGRTIRKRNQSLVSD